MNKLTLLEQLRDLALDATKDIIMPVSPQKGDAGQVDRAADVYLMRLPDSKSAQKKAPYIIIQLLSSDDVQAPGSTVESSAVVRLIFCVYSDDEQEGGLMLLNLMERLRIRLLKQVVIGNQFRLDLEHKLESLIYPDNTAPYFAGEMASTWQIPAIQQEVYECL